MTPLYLNPFPLVELKEDDHHHVHLFIPVPDQSGSILKDSHHVDKVEKHIWHSGSSDGHIVSSSSSSSLNPEGESGHKLCLRKRSEDGNDNNSAKWMSSKMRLMQRMMSSNCALTEKPGSFAQTFPNDKEINFAKNGNNSSIRVCSDCNTTSTPLWRSGPLGPKSLCNACGIRQRKARRAMAEAANGVDITATQTSSMKAKVHNKEKKSRTSNLGQYKKQYCKPVDTPSESQKKLCFTDFALSLSENSAFQRVFPQDEEEAAILLMQLSCHGLVHS